MMSHLRRNAHTDRNCSIGGTYWLPTVPWYRTISMADADGQSSDDTKVKKSNYNPNEDTTMVEDHEIDEHFSMSLMRLKLEDRNEIREEVHGVRSLAREETPELINCSLHRMNAELERIISTSRPNQYAFQKARNFKKTFVNDSDFRLKFLRCELFDPIKAADRMIVYLDYLELLFGRRGLEEPLNSSFFNKVEAAALRDGNIQLLPFRDRSGRRIMIVLWRALSYSPMLRVR